MDNQQLSPFKQEKFNDYLVMRVGQKFARSGGVLKIEE